LAKLGRFWRYSPAIWALHTYPQKLRAAQGYHGRTELQKCRKYTCSKEPNGVTVSNKDKPASSLEAMRANDDGSSVRSANASAAQH